MFGKRLNDDQHALVRSDVTIVDEDKLQFYLEQMYNSNHFDKNKMLTWEKQPTATKTDYDTAKNYFEALVKATDTSEMNAGGGPPDATSTSEPISWPTTAMKSRSSSQKSQGCQRAQRAVRQQMRMQQQSKLLRWRRRSKR